MTSSQCATTVHAIRDSELACLPAGLLDTIKLKQPQVRDIHASVSKDIYMDIGLDNVCSSVYTCIHVCLVNMIYFRWYLD